MQKVFIFNKNEYPLREMFKGEEVTINAHDFWRTPKGEKREFDLFEANDFRGQYHPVPFDGSGKMLNDPKHFKMLDMIPTEAVAKPEPDVSTYKCMAKECKHVSPSAEELEAHTKVRHGSVEKLVLPEVEATIAKKAKSA